MLNVLLPFGKMRETFVRFPLSALCTILLFVLTILMIHGVLDDQDERIVKVMAVLGFGFFWSGAVRLFQLSQTYRGWLYYALSAIGVTVFTAIIYLSPNIYALYFSLMMLPVSLISIGLAGYLGRSRSDLSFWYFNRKTWQGVGVASLAGIIWGAGSSAALLAVDTLFGVDIDRDLYMDIWVASLAFLTPLYALSWVPDKFDFTEEECEVPPQLCFVINWILGPLSLIYLLILYAYFVKIAVQWDIPNGQLSVLTMGFAGVSVASYLISYPLRESGNILIRLLHRYLLPLLIVPAAMQGWALWTRISAYGITEERYLVGLSADFFLIAALLFTGAKLAGKSLSIRVLPGMLALLLLIGSFGPWGVVSVSERSQLARLEALLEESGILIDGEIVKAPAPVSFEKRKEISSRLDYFSWRSHVSKLHYWFEFETVKGRRQQYFNVTDAADSMGIKYVSRWETDRDVGHFSFYKGDAHLPLIVSGYDYVLNSDYQALIPEQRMTWEWALENGAVMRAKLLDGNVLDVLMDGQSVVRFDVEAFIQPVLERGEYSVLDQWEMPEAENNGMRIKAEIRNLYGRENSKGGMELKSLDFRLYIRLAQGRVQ